MKMWNTHLFLFGFVCVDGLILPQIIRFPDAKIVGQFNIQTYKTMLVSQPQDALGSLVKIVVIVETVETAETAETVETVETVETI